MSPAGRPVQRRGESHTLGSAKNHRSPGWLKTISSRFRCSSFQNCLAIYPLASERQQGGISSLAGWFPFSSNSSNFVVSFIPFLFHCEIRHGRLLKRGLFGVNPTLEELHGEHEACLVARARARLLLALADCSAMLPSEGVEGGPEVGEEGGGGGAEVLRRVRDAADCILGEVLQVKTTDSGGLKYLAAFVIPLEIKRCRGCGAF